MQNHNAVVIMDFKEFFSTYLAAIREEDKAFMEAVYKDWFETSGVVPKEQEDYFYSAMFGELQGLLEGKLEGTESIDGFTVAHLKGQDGSDFSLTFMEKGGSWIFFDARTNMALFGKVYGINYDVKGGRLRILFNGKRSPIVTDIEEGRNGFISIINSALVKGENEITLESLDGTPLEVSLQISSARRGDIMDSGQGDVLDWRGTVREPVKMKIDAE